MDITPARKWALTQIFYQDVLKELDTHFNKLNVEYMPIKGTYLICMGLAEKMKERFISDIDILVQEEDMQKASDYFAKLEKTELKTYYKDNYRPTETIFNYSLSGVKICVEIHSMLNFPQRFLLPTSELFARSRTAAGIMRFPSPEDALLILLCHTQTHMPFEYKETLLEEIDLLASQQGFRWETFWKLSLSTGIESFIYLMLLLYKKEYNIPIQFPRYYLYSNMVAAMFSQERYNRMSRWARRLFLELPFVRKPVGLLFYKVFHTKKEKTL